MARFRSPDRDVPNSKQEYWIKKKQTEWIEIATMGKRFVTENNSGYLYEGKKHYDWIRGRTITGQNYKPTACRCIPWDACSCGRA